MDYMQETNILHNIKMVNTHFSLLMFRASYDLWLHAWWFYYSLRIYSQYLSTPVFHNNLAVFSDANGFAGNSTASPQYKFKLLRLETSQCVLIGGY